MPTEPNRAPSPSKEAEPSNSPPTPVQQKSRQFGVEAPPAPSSSGTRAAVSSAGHPVAAAADPAEVDLAEEAEGLGSSEQSHGEIRPPGP